MMAFILWARKNRAMVLHIASVLVILTLLLAMYLKGSHDATLLAKQKADLKAAQDALVLANAKTAAAQLALAQQKVTTKVVTEYIDRVKVIHEQGKTIIQEVPKYVTQADDRRCTIPTGFVQLWNLSNTGSSESHVPDTTGSTDASPGGTLNIQIEEVPSDVTLTDVAQQHVLESEYTLTVEEQLRSLQEWVREQEKLSLTP